MLAQAVSPALHAPACAGRARPARRAQVVRAQAVEEVLKSGAKTTAEVPPGLNKYSARITQPKSQGASQAMLYGTGLTEADMNKPQASAGDELGGRRRCCGDWLPASPS